MLQLQGSLSEWIREPRATAPAVRPALLLPGGGAVMLPVDETGRNLPPGPMYPLPETQSLWTPQVETRVTKVKPNDNYIRCGSFTTLGEAGERMIKELGLGMSHGVGAHTLPSSQFVMSPTVFYQPYHLPVYIPPSYSHPSFCASPALNARAAPAMSPSPDVEVFYNDSKKSQFDVPERMKAWRKVNEMTGPQHPDKSKTAEKEMSKHRYNPKIKSEDIASDYIRSDPRMSNTSIVDASSSVLPGRKKDLAEKTRDNFEIECLASDNNIEEDPNWSDDEVLDVAMGRTLSPYHDNVTENLPESDGWKPDHLEEQVRRLQAVDPKPVYRDTQRRAEDEVLEYRQPHQVTRAPNLPMKQSEISSPVAQIAQKVVVAHQKSINELKAILSFEEEENPPTHGIPDQSESFAALEQGNHESQFLVDEDVPEDFTEQNYPESHYDPRYQRDVSRNVILEEDEEEEEEKQVVTKPVAPAVDRRDDWRRLQQYRQQGKLNAANFPRRSEHNPVPQGQGDGRIQEPHMNPQQYNHQLGALDNPSGYVNDPRQSQNEGHIAATPIMGALSRPHSGGNNSPQHVHEGYRDGTDARQHSLDLHYPEEVERQRSPTGRNPQQEFFEQNVGEHDREPNGVREEYNQHPQENLAYQREALGSQLGDGFIGNEGRRYGQEGEGGYGGEPVESNFPDQQQEPSPYDYGQQPPHQEFDQRPEHFDSYQQEGYEHQPMKEDDQYVEYNNAQQQGDEYYQDREPPAEHPQHELIQDGTDNNYVQNDQLPQQHPDYNLTPSENYNRYEEYSENSQNYAQGNEHFQEGNGEMGQQEQYDDYPRETDQPSDYNTEAPQYPYDGQEQPQHRAPDIHLGGHPEESREQNPPIEYQHDRNPSQNVDYIGHPSDPNMRGGEPASEPKPSVLNQLMDSESESYQVEPAQSAHDDSDFDFSIGKQ